MLTIAGRQANNAILFVLLIVSLCFGWYAPAFYMQSPSDQELDLIARVAAGEARGRPVAEQAAVCHVVLNRFLMGRWGRWTGVLKARRQFSPMLTTDPNYALVTAPGFEHTKAYLRAYSVCGDVIQGRMDRHLADPTRGADHFHSGAKRPWWAKGKKVLARVGSFRFYRLQRPLTL